MKTNKEWIQWGKLDPLWAVASWQGRESKGVNPWTTDEFYQLGESDWKDFDHYWQKSGCNLEHMLEIGCGAGRLTRAISKATADILALDVSKDQIAIAKSHCPQHVRFQVTNGTQIPLQDGAATAVFSAHVFQHFECLEDARAVFVEINRVLQPGGSLFIHLPVFNFPETAIHKVFAFMHGMNKILGNLRAQIRRSTGRVFMRSLWYERSWLSENLSRSGFSHMEFVTFQVASNGSWHSFVYARK